MYSLKQRKQIRDLIYVNSNLKEKYFYSYGIEFKEFMNAVSDPPDNLILLKHNFNGADWNQHTRFDIVTKNEIDQLINDNVYNYGDFCWVDFLSEDDLNRMNNEEIAELLFFGHLANPLRKLPITRFAYYAHDDGWFNKLFVNQLSDYSILLSKVIINKINVFSGRNYVSISAELEHQLLEKTTNGLLIDFKKIIKNRNEIRIPVSEVGQFTDMDKVYDMRSEITDCNTWLIFSNKKCELIIEG